MKKKKKGGKVDRQALAKKEAERIRKEKEEAAEKEAAKKKEEEEKAKLDNWDDSSSDSDDAPDDWDIDSDEEAQKKEDKEKKKLEKKKKLREEKLKREEEKKKQEEEKRKQEEEEKKKEEELKKQREEQGEDIDDSEKRQGLRSPICCILGHVDTGKTKLLDKIRQTNVQDKEAGGITQQIGATFFPVSAIKAKTKILYDTLKTKLTYELPGLLVIDTPGHESFTNLRSRGSNLCDIAILVVDIMHGLEPQTLESIDLLRKRKTPFIVALNKVDRIYGWAEIPDNPFTLSLKEQKEATKSEFDNRAKQAIAAFAEQGLNTKLYYENKDFRSNISLVPTSAHTGEGIPDLLMLLTQLCQKRMNQRLQYISGLQCTVLEVKVVEGLGTTIDVVLVNGVLHEGQTIVVCGMNGPIVTNIRALLTPPPMREIRVKSEYIHNKTVHAAMGVKISANGLEHAVAGTQLLVCGPRDDIEALKDEIMQDFASILSKVDKSGEGVCVQASTLGSLEALLAFLEESKIPVSGINIGPVHKKDVMRASTMLERRPEFAVILAFDVPVDKGATQMAEKSNVKIFTADIIYHLFDKCTEYMDEIKNEKRKASSDTAVFPCVLEVLPEHIFNVKDPIILGIRVVEGILKVGTPLCVPDAAGHDGKNPLMIGKITRIEFNNEEKDEALKSEEVAVRIEQSQYDSKLTFGRQFGVNNKLVSKLTRESINLLKANFKDDLKDEHWRLVIKLKRLFQIL